jgi:hypothetical protein
MTMVLTGRRIAEIPYGSMRFHAYTEAAEWYCETPGIPASCQRLLACSRLISTNSKVSPMQYGQAFGLSPGAMLGVTNMGVEMTQSPVMLVASSSIAFVKLFNFIGTSARPFNVTL